MLLDEVFTFPASASPLSQDTLESVIQKPKMVLCQNSPIETSKSCPVSLALGLDKTPKRSSRKCVSLSASCVVREDSVYTDIDVHSKMSCSITTNHHSVKTSLRVRMINQVSDLFKDILVEIRNDLNLFDAIYDKKAVRKANIRKWGSAVNKQVKCGSHEICCSIWDDEVNSPCHTYSIEDMKQTSTRQLYHLVGPESDLIKLKLQCVEKKTVDVHPTLNATRNFHSQAQESSACASSNLNNSITDDLKSPNFHSFERSAENRNVTQTIRTESRFNHPTISSKDSSSFRCPFSGVAVDGSVFQQFRDQDIDCLPRHSNRSIPANDTVSDLDETDNSTIRTVRTANDTYSLLSTKSLSQSVISAKATMRVKISNESSNRYKDLVVDIKPDLFVHDSIYDHNSVKSAGVRKWTSDVVKEVNKKAKVVQCEVLDGSAEGKVCEIYALDDLKKLSTKDLFDLVSKRDPVQLVLRCVNTKIKHSMTETCPPKSHPSNNKLPTVPSRITTQQASISSASRRSSRPNHMNLSALTLNGSFSSFENVSRAHANASFVSDDKILAKPSCLRSKNDSLNPKYFPMPFSNADNISSLEHHKYDRPKRDDVNTACEGLETDSKKQHVSIVDIERSKYNSQPTASASAAMNLSKTDKEKLREFKTLCRSKMGKEFQSRENIDNLTRPRYKERRKSSIDPRNASFKSSASDVRNASFKSASSDIRSVTLKSSASDTRNLSLKSTGFDALNASLKSSASDTRSATLKSSTSDTRNDSLKSAAFDELNATLKSAASDTRNDTLKSLASDTRNASLKSSASDIRNASLKSSASYRRNASSKSSASDTTSNSSLKSSICDILDTSLKSSTSLTLDHALTTLENQLADSKVTNSTPQPTISSTDKISRFLEFSAKRKIPVEEVVKGLKRENSQKSIVPPIAEIEVVKGRSNVVTEPSISFSGDLVKEIFPYHIVINGDFRIIQVGNSLCRLMENEFLIGKCISDIFTITGPIPSFGKQWDWKVMKKMKEKTIFLEGLYQDSTNQKPKMKGSIIELMKAPKRQVLLTLSPNVKNLSELESMNLSMTDLPLHSCQRDAVLLGEHSKSEVKLTNHLDVLHRDLINSMEKQIEDRTNELATANTKLELANAQLAIQSAKQLEHFACMSHEIRTPLNCIVGMSSLLLEDSEGPSMDPMHADSIRMINTSGELLRAVVDDVLDYAKLESGSFEVDIKSTKLQDTLESVLYSISQKIKDNNIRLRTHFTPTVPEFIETDSRRLQQVLFNLLGNAGKFSMKDSVIDLSVSLIKASSQNRSSEQNDNLDLIRFSVRDYGKGIEKKDFETIFQPFSQASKETQTIYGGTGLGLSITSKLVHRLGGTISLNSEIGKFADFTVDLPMHGKHVEVENISNSLKNVSIVFIEPRQITENSFQSFPFKAEPVALDPGVVGVFGLNVIRCHSVDELKNKISLKRGTKTQQHFSLIVHESFYRFCSSEKLDSILGQSQYSLMTYGANFLAGKTRASHFKSLTGLSPATLLESIAKQIVQQKNLKFKAASLSPNNGLETGTPISSNTKKKFRDKSDSGCPHQKTVSTSSKTPTSSHNNITKQNDFRKDMKVLYAEDNLVNQKVLSRVLNRSGITDVTIVDNGKKAVDLSATVKYDCILLDMQMPVMDGMEACKIIMERDPDTIIVFVTAHALDEFKAKAKAAGAKGFISKPFRVGDIDDVLKKIYEN